jgi:hypothetical protein
MAAKTLDIPAINELTVSKKRETGIKLGGLLLSGMVIL